MSAKKTSGSYKMSGVSPICDRLKMYKMTTPPWKETFRQVYSMYYYNRQLDLYGPSFQRCFQRLRDNRERIVRRFRESASDQSPVSAVCIENEWKSLQKEEAADLEAYLSIYEELQRELIDEEERIIRECYEYENQFEQEAMDAAVASFYDDSVLCPICVRVNIFLDVFNGIICCSDSNCSFRVLTGIDISSWNCSHISSIFDHLLSEHFTINGCLSKPTFIVQPKAPEPEFQNLIIHCQTCGYRNVVF